MSFQHQGRNSLQSLLLLYPNARLFRSDRKRTMEEMYNTFCKNFIGYRKFVLKDLMKQSEEFKKFRLILIEKSGDSKEVPKKAREELTFWKRNKVRTSKYLELDQNFEISWDTQYYSFLNNKDIDKYPNYKSLVNCKIYRPVKTSHTLPVNSQSTVSEPHPKPKNRKKRKVIQKQSEMADLVNGETLIVRINVTRTNLLNPKPKLGQTFILHGDNTLVDLRDAIGCELDYFHSSKPDHKFQKDVFQSAMFYINNTFYIDTRKPENLDYSEPIKEWAKGKNIDVGKTITMQSTYIKDLTVMLRYPYLYQHLGDCEHFVSFETIKLLNDKDCHFSQNYPHIENHGVAQQPMLCQRCGKNKVECIVTGSKRVYDDIFKICRLCYEQFFTIDGKPIEPQVICYPCDDKIFSF